MTIPSWVIRPESRASNGSMVNPIVFYRVQVGLQSPEGITTARGVLRRFSDFLKLFAALKKAFPKKNIPPAPPKHSLLRINSSQLLVEERRYALEEWMSKVLSDIDLSRSVPVAAFLELEAAARSSFQDANQQISDANPHVGRGDSTTSTPLHPNLRASVVAGSSSDVSKTLFNTLDYGSDNAYETSDLGTPRQRGDSSEICTEDLSFDQELAAPIESLVKYGVSDDDNGLFMGGLVLEQMGDLPRNKLQSENVNKYLGKDSFNGNASEDAFLSRERMGFLSERERDKVTDHTRKHSAESVGSDMSSIRGSDLSNTGAMNSLGDNSVDLAGGTEAPSTMEAFAGSGIQFLNEVHVVLPLDQRNKMSRVLTTMQRRLVTAKTDMEDLIARLNQEIAVKDYLTTKVKDLDVELESTKQKNKENLQQAILLERERVTQMQWDMEELRRKCLEMDSKLKCEQDEKVRAESAKISAIGEMESLLQELDVTREQLENAQKRKEELELKSKADIKVLVKEVKSLRKAQIELKQDLNQSLKEKAELERTLKKDKQRREQAKAARMKLLHECQILRNRLQECSVNFLAEEEDKFTVDSSSLSDALDLLTTSDNRIGLLLAEAQLLAQDDESAVAAADNTQSNELHGDADINGNDSRVTDDEVRKTLADIFTDNARLRKQVNSIIRCALKTAIKPEKEEAEEAPSRKTVLNKFLER